MTHLLASVKPRPNWARALLGSAVTAACLFTGESALADGKSIAVRSPSGRQIYENDSQFAKVRDQDRRYLIVELLSGLAPEGHLGMLMGIINIPAKGFEFYSGIAFEANPAFSVPVSARYMMNFGGFRPYASLGYSYRSLEKVDLWSHNAFAEVGHKWILHHTYHLTLGVGLRRPLQVVLRETSPLRGPTTDSELLDDQIGRSLSFVPTFAVRFSRAF